jgi:hypothetical protein
MSCCVGSWHFHRACTDFFIECKLFHKALTFSLSAELSHPFFNARAGHWSYSLATLGNLFSLVLKQATFLSSFSCSVAPQGEYKILFFYTKSLKTSSLLILEIGDFKTYGKGFCYSSCQKYVCNSQIPVVGKMTTFDLWLIPLGGGAWGAGINMWHPKTLASYESLPAPLNTQIPTLWIHISGGERALWY